MNSSQTYRAGGANAAATTLGTLLKFRPLRYLAAVVAWLLAGIVGFGLLYLIARIIGFLYGLLPSSILGLAPLAWIFILGMLAIIVFSSKRLFILKRLFAMIIVSYLIATLVFILVHTSPYDPIKLALGQHAADPVLVAMGHRLFGMDKPIHVQYLNYMGGLLHGNLGYSVGQDTMGTPVWDMIKNGVPQSLKLGGYALLLSLYIGIPIGLVSALKQNSVVDHGSQAVMIILFAIPPFVLAPVAQIIFAVQLGWLPVQGWNTPGQEIQELVLPVTIFAAGIAGFLAKSYRSFMLEILRQDYIRTARAKGLREWVVIGLHACKNTLSPLASIVGPLIAFLVVGAFIIESFFGIPGIGYDTVQAVQTNDGPVIEATTLLLALAVVFINMLTDIFYAMVDPRVKL